jgi:hypothetical protein
MTTHYGLFFYPWPIDYFELIKMIVKQHQLAVIAGIIGLLLIVLILK